VSTAAVGADIESICSTCGDVWHVVVAKVGDKIAKVQCKQCGKLHRHKPPGEAGASASSSGGGASSSKTSSRTTKPRVAVAAPKPPDEPLVAADQSRPVRTYKASDTFSPGDRVQHPTFGTGVVELSPGPGKIQVFFPDGRRILAQAKAVSTLERPTPPAVEPKKM
jgi:hypothetical protein